MLWVLALVLPIVIAMAWSISHAHELFMLSVRNGRVLVVRGRIPQSLLDAIEDVLTRAAVQRASLQVHLDGGQPRCVTSGVDDHVAQRLRNVVGTVPLGRLRAAPPPAQPNLGQRLGIAWLAWWLHSGSRREAR